MCRCAGDSSSGAGRLFTALALGAARRGIEVMPNDKLAPTMQLVTWRTEWPPAAPPQRWLGGRPVPAPGELYVRMPAPLPGGLPQCAFSPKVALARSGAGEGGADLLLGGDDRPRAVFIDVDEDTFLGPAPEDPARKTFDAEAGFFFSAQGDTAFYDTRNRGTFDLILVDRDHDGLADLRYTLRGGGWRREEGVSPPWLSTAHLAFLDSGPSSSFDRDPLLEQARRDAVRRFSVLARRAPSP